VELEGLFSTATEDGAEVGKLLEEGFPWQASVGIFEGSTEFVREGEETEVNGHKLKGPGTIFRKSTLREVSFVALGADRQTSAEAFAAGGSDESIIAAFTVKETQMADKQDPTTPPTPPPEPTPAPPEAKAAAAPAVPAAPAAPATFTAKEVEDLVEKKVQAAVKAHADSRRIREAKLRPLAFAHQEQLLQDLIAGDKPIEDCALELVRDFKEKGGAKLAALQKDPAAGVGAGSGTVETSALSASEEQLVAGGEVNEEKAKEKFAQSPELRAEFGTEPAYLAYLRALARGAHRFRIVEGQRSAS
jgi:hypothetical protein